MFKKTFFLLLVIPLLLLISACNINLSTTTTSTQTIIPTIEVNSSFETQYEVGSDIPDWDKAFIINGEITGVLDANDVGMNTVGKFDVIYTVTISQNSSISKSITITIVDTTLPSFEGLADMTLEVGSSEPDWLSGVSVIDNYDQTITLTTDNVDASYVNLNEVGTYEVIYTVSDSNDNIATDNITVAIVDTTIPVLTLNGEEEVKLFIGQEYTELGATALDNKTIDLSADIIIISDVDTSVLGDYTITYKVTDASGNENSITRIVHVVDDILLMIEDENMKIAVLNTLGKTAGPVTRADVLEIEVLQASDSNLTSINGIEQLINLKEVFLHNNQITDITPLDELNNLEIVVLVNNPIDISIDSANYQVVMNFITNNIICDLNGQFIEDDHSDILDNATSIELNTILSGIYSYSLDSDYFVFTLDSETEISINLTPINEKIYILYGENVNSTEFYDEFTIFNLQPGTYYIRVIAALIDEPINYELNVSEYSNEELHFVDSNLERAIRDELGIYNRELTEADLLSIEDLSAGDYGITDLTGIEQLENLMFLELENNQITNIDALQYLPQLEFVVLSGNLITDITPLDNLPNLYFAILMINPIEVIEGSANYNVVMNFINSEVISDINGLLIPDDYSDFPQDAIPIPLNSTFIGSHDYSLDSDYFVFTLSEEMTISIDLSIEDSAYILYDENLEELSFSDGLSVHNLQAGTYFIRVLTAFVFEPIIYELSIYEFLDTELTFLDPGLENAIRNELGIYNDSLYFSDVMSIEELYIANSFISNLIGIENLVNLTELDLQFNNITDITPLFLLPNLNLVRLENNPIDITIGNDNYNVLQYFIDNDIVCDLNGILIPDDYNDTFLDATPITIGDTITGSLDYQFDKDYFTFTIVDDTLIDVLINSSNDVYFEVYDQYNSLIYVINNNNLFTFTSDTYTICVKGDVSSSYVFTLDYHAPQEVFFADINLEHVIKDHLGIDYGTPLYDEDVIFITHLDGSNREITSLGGIGSLVNLVELNLENNLITDITPLYDLPNLHSVLLLNNSIDIIMGNANDAVIDYLVMSAIFCDIIPDDHGNTFDTSTNLTLNSSLSGRIESYYDVDYFTFTLTETTIVNIYSVLAENEYRNHIELNLFNDNQEWIAYGDISYDRIIMSLEPGTYYISITLFDAYGDYELFVEETTPVSLNNPQLEQAIKDELGIDNRELTEADILGLDELYAGNYGITHLTGIDQLINLHYLNLMDNDIQDISQLATLTSLTQLELGNNQISNIDALQNLTQLTNLELSNNFITNINVLQYLRQLEEVILMGNQISDITSLDNLPNLEVVVVADNPIDVTEGSLNYQVVMNFIARDVMCDLNGLFIEDDHSDIPVGATQIELNSTMIGIHNYALDSDYFKFTLTNATTVSINLLPHGDNVYILYDENFQNLSFMSGFYVYELQSGTYYIRVASGFTEEVMSYELTLNEFLETPLTFIDPNLEEAIRDQVGVYDRNLYQSDVNIIQDFYARYYLISDLTGIENLVNLTHLYLQDNNITDLTPLVELLNLEFISLYGNPIANNTVNQTVYDYFIANNIYCDTIPDEYGNTFETSTEINLTTSVYNGMISPSGDIDFFHFTITDITSIALYTVSNLDTIGYLYDSSGNEIVMGDDSDNDSDFLIEITLHPGVYYLKVSEYGSNFGTYTLYYETIE